MDGYICIKALTLAGTNYVAGDDIPAAAVLPNRVRSLKRQGYIAQRVGQTEAPAVPLGESNVRDTIIVPLETKDGLTEFTISADNIIEAISKLQLNADESINFIEGSTNVGTLVLIDAMESRKTVKSAIMARIEALKPAYNNSAAEGEQGDV